MVGSSVHGRFAVYENEGKHENPCSFGNWNNKNCEAKLSLLTHFSSAGCAERAWARSRTPNPTQT